MEHDFVNGGDEGHLGRPMTVVWGKSTANVPQGGQCKMMCGGLVNPCLMACME